MNAGNASSWWVMQAGVKVLSTTRFLNPTFPTFLTNQFCVLWLSLLIQFGMVGIPTKHCFFLNKNLFNLFFTSLGYIFILSCFIGKLHVGSKAGKKYKTSKILRAKHYFSCKLTLILPLQINLSQGILFFGSSFQNMLSYSY